MLNSMRPLQRRALGFSRKMPNDSDSIKTPEASFPQCTAERTLEGNHDVSEMRPGDFAHYLNHFTLADMVRCGAALRVLAAESATLEQAAQKVTRYLYDSFGDDIANNRACVLVRFFKTLSHARLPEELRQIAASRVSPARLCEDTKCLTLIASAGDDPSWNSRRASAAHQCIALASEIMVEQFPMIHRLIGQLGLTTTELLSQKAEIIKDLDQKGFGVFHVPVAANSPFVPAQKDFVAPHRIASVLGFGGMLPDGDLFTVIIFSRAAIGAATAEMFRTIALNLKLGLLTLLDKPLFAE